MKETSDVALQIQSDLRPVTARTTRTKFCMIAAIFAVAVSVVIGIPFAVIFLKPRPAYLQRQSRFSSAALHPGLLNPTAAPSYPVSGTIRQQVHIQASASPSEVRLLHMEYEAVVNDQMTIFALDHEDVQLRAGLTYETHRLCNSCKSKVRDCRPQPAVTRAARTQ